MMKTGHCMISLTGLKEGSHVYSFRIGSDFFALYEGSEITGGEIVVEVNLVKRSSHLELLFSLSGKVQLLCDRCLELFLYDLKGENRIYAKFGDHYEEVDDEIIIIPYGEGLFSLDQLVYEFAHLALPIRRYHPDGKDIKSGCDPKMLARITGEADKKSSFEPDPRWQGLEGIKKDLLN